jgi:hypothetical protein
MAACRRNHQHLIPSVKAIAMTRLLRLCLNAVVPLSVALASRDARPSAQRSTVDPHDSVTWDTSAWVKLQGAHPIATKPLGTDPLLIGFLSDVFDTLGRLRTVARDPVAWDSLWVRITSHGRYAGACCRTAPVIDFKREMILAVGNGVHQDGDDVAIVRAAVRRDTLYVYVLSMSHMLPKCLLDARINPVAVVRTGQWTGPVLFAEGFERGSCAKYKVGVRQ